MTIPPRFLDEIRNRLTLSEVIGRRINVQRAGREFKACCPFHKEKSPSFTINDDKQFYHCFGCGAHGDVIGFVMQHDNLSFIDALEMLSADAGLQMPKPDPQAAKKAEEQRGLHELMDEATSWMQTQIDEQDNKDVLDYLETRGMDAATRAAFRIGFAPADGQALRKALAAKGFTDTQMLEAGVLKKSTKGGEPYIFFRERVMFPVADRRGRIIAFGGRILPEHVRANKNPDFTPPKYINSSDTPLFDKSRVLYGEAHARQAAREGHTIIVTEGYMDVIACHKAGFKGAVAPMGTAMTEEQIISVWSMMIAEEKSPVLCFDGDNAGRSAAGRAAQRILPLLKPNQSARFAFIPDGEDPDSLLRSGGAGALKSVLQAALPLFDFIWASHTAGRNFETPEKRAGLEKTLYKEIMRIKDPDVQRYYKELVRTRISETFFPRYQQKNAQNKTKPQLKKPSNPASSLKIKRPQGANTAIKDRILLATIINHPHIYPDIEEEFGAFVPQNASLEHVRNAIIDFCGESDALDSETLCNHLKNQGLEQETGDILNESVYVHAVFSRPGDPESTDSNAVKAGWLGLWQGVQGNNLDREIREGWRQAYESGNEEEEIKLRHMVTGRITDE